MDQSFHLQKLGQAFKAMRTNRGLTQEALARLAGVTRLKVIAIEAGPTWQPSIHATELQSHRITPIHRYPFEVTAHARY
jgi:DNA-binding XRE family transcriptional regulator